MKDAITVLWVQSISLFGTSLIFALAITPLIMRLAIVYGLYDLPDLPGSQSANLESGSRRIHKTPVPRLGGIAVALSFVLSICVWFAPTALANIYLPSLAIFAVGVFDDVKPLPAWLRLAVQGLCASLVVGLAKLEIGHLYLTSTFGFPLPYAFGFGLSVFIIVGAINSINMIDGLDGLASGIMTIGVALLSYLHFIVTKDSTILFAMSLPLVGSLIGFLRYNTYPARIFLGDGGSNWLGFMVGVLILLVANQFTLSTINGDYELVRRTIGVNAMPIISIILCLAVPVFDTACVVATRLRDRINPMYADKRHFHHTLLRIGLTHRQSVTVIYFVALAASLIGILPIAYPDYPLWWLPYIAACGLAVLILLSMRLDEKVIERFLQHKVHFQSRAIGIQTRAIVNLLESSVRATIYFICLAAPLLSGIVSNQLGVAAAAAAGVIVITKIFRTKPTDSYSSLLVCIGATVVLISINQNPIMLEILSTKYQLQFLYNYSFIYLFCASLALIFLTFGRRYLLVTPTDFLLVIFPLLMILAPPELKQTYKLDIISIRCLILFTAVQILSKRRAYAMSKVELATLFALLYIAAAGLLKIRIIYS